MNERLWNKIDEYNRPFYINSDDICIYAREYIKGIGYIGGQVNSDILNFKKRPKQKGFKYRQEAIKKFKKDIEQFFKLFDKKGNKVKTIIAIPSSKVKTDPKYDFRFEHLFKELEKTTARLIIECPIVIKKTITASRYSKKRLAPNDIKKNYIWKGFKKKVPKLLFVFDDLLNSGSHFRAVSDFLKENEYTGKIIGMFWAKATEDNTEWFK